MGIKVMEDKVEEVVSLEKPRVNSYGSCTMCCLISSMVGRVLSPTLPGSLQSWHNFCLYRPLQYSTSFSRSPSFTQILQGPVHALIHSLVAHGDFMDGELVSHLHEFSLGIPFAEVADQSFFVFFSPLTWARMVLMTRMVLMNRFSLSHHSI